MAQEDLGKKEPGDRPAEVEHGRRRIVHEPDPQVGCGDHHPLRHAFHDEGKAEFLLLDELPLPREGLGRDPEVIGDPAEKWGHAGEDHRAKVTPRDPSRRLSEVEEGQDHQDRGGPGNQNGENHRRRACEKTVHCDQDRRTRKR